MSLSIVNLQSQKKYSVHLNLKNSYNRVDQIKDIEIKMRNYDLK